MGRISRSEVCARLTDQISQGRPVLAVGAGSGLIARGVEAGGADLIAVYSYSRFGMMGFGRTAGALPFCNANALTFEYGTREVLPNVKNTPVIFGACANDPTINIEKYLASVADEGFSGVVNIPGVSLYGTGYFRDILDDSYLGFDREVAMMQAACRLDLFTVAFVCTTEEARSMADAGVDVMVGHLGLTKGSAVGAKKGWIAATLDEAASKTQELIDAAKAVNRDIIFLNHGGPIATPEDAAYVMMKTDTIGTFAGLPVEVTAVEIALKDATKGFKSLRWSGARTDLYPLSKSSTRDAHVS